MSDFRYRLVDWWLDYRTAICASLVAAVAIIVIVFTLNNAIDRKCAVVWSHARTHSDTILILAQRRCTLRAVE